MCRAMGYILKVKALENCLHVQRSVRQPAITPPTPNRCSTGPATPACLHACHVQPVTAGRPQGDRHQTCNNAQCNNELVYTVWGGWCICILLFPSGLRKTHIHQPVVAAQRPGLYKIAFQMARSQVTGQHQLGPGLGAQGPGMGAH